MATSPVSTAKDLFARGFNVFHENLLRLTKGRIGGSAFGMPVVILWTTGRKTGQKRRTMLTSPVHDDNKVVLVASWGGDDRHPTWYLNLRDNPDVEIEINGQHKKMTARIADAAEKAELWPSVTKQYGGYASYQKRTDRDIPLVILEPRT